jgi:PAS domain S-box-containing protein
MDNETPLEDTKEISCRVTRTLLLYVKERNSGTLRPLLDGLPLGEAYLSDTNNWVSHELLQVIYKRLIDLLGDQNAVYHMALASGRLHSLGILERIVRVVGSPRLIYLQAPRFNRFLKLNGSVYIHEVGDSYVVLEDRYHDSYQKTRFDCDYTRGILAGIPTIFGLPLADVEEMGCQVAPEKYGHRIWPDHPPQGHNGCVYRVTWLPKKIPFLRRFFYRRKAREEAIEDLVQANRLIQSKYDEVKRLMEDLKEANRELVVSRREMEAHKNALVESERKYRLLAENVSDTIWVVDLSTLTYVYISPSVEKHRGFTPDEAMAQSLSESLSPESLTRLTQLLETELEKDNEPGTDPHRSATIEIEVSLKHGGYSWAEATVSFIRDSKGAPTALMGVTRDIAERKQTERIVVESEKKYRDLFENGSDLLCVHDLEGRILESNLAYKEEYGWHRQAAEVINIRALLPERHQAKFDAYLQRIIEKGTDEGYMKAYTAAGEEVILEYHNRLILDQRGQPKAVQGAARDVTQRIRSEKALKESEEKYKNIVQYAPAGIFEFDIRSVRFTSVNDVMCQYTGYNQSEFMALDPCTLLTEQSKKQLNRLIEKLSDQKPHDFSAEYQLVGKNNQMLFVLVNLRLFYEDGVPMRAMAVVHDITQIKKAEEEKRALEVKLQNAKKLESLGTLAGGVAHDLNNILSGIVSYPDLLLLDLNANSPMREPLLAIKKSGQKASAIVQDLLTLARRNVTTKKGVDLNTLVSEFIATPECRKIIEGRDDIRLDTRLSGGITHIDGSEAHLSKTLMNLVSNAVDAMPAGGRIDIATRDAYLDQPYIGYEFIPEGEYAILEVTDAGIGMPRVDLEKIFEPFYTKKVMGRSGTGLGMSVIWGTVKDHDGYIDIATKEGTGTTFTLYFPISRSDWSDLTEIHIDDYLGNGESILIVDDAPEQRELSRRMVQRLGYAVDTAASGEIAVSMVAEKDYDLLILDMIMPPGMDGLATYRQILSKAPNQKAVIASGYSKSNRVEEAQRLGAGGYVKKPFTLEAIGLAVRTELDRS